LSSPGSGAEREEEGPGDVGEAGAAAAAEEEEQEEEEGEALLQASTALASSSPLTPKSEQSTLTKRCSPPGLRLERAWAATSAAASWLFVEEVDEEVESDEAIDAEALSSPNAAASRRALRPARRSSRAAAASEERKRRCRRQERDASTRIETRKRN
jgi:hypothetical protein